MATALSWSLLRLAIVCSSVSVFCLFLQTADAVCMHGFGEFCEYRCHCQFWNECLKSNGDCKSGGCLRGFAGTACQYDNVAFKQRVEANFSTEGLASDLKKVTDGDESSCFVEKDHHNLPLTLTLKAGGGAAQAWVNVIQLVLPRNESLGTVATAEELEVHYFLSDTDVDDSNNNDDKNVPTLLQPHLPQPNDMVLMYRLPKPAQVTKVQIRVFGNSSLGLCEINMFGGRNLAIQKSTSQGKATYVDSKGSSASAGLAVDGQFAGTSGENTCSRTESVITGQPPLDTWWTVSLGRRLSIWRVKLYNGTDLPLDTFAINVTLTDRSEVTLYRHNESETSEFTDIILPEPVPATQLTIWREEAGTNLELCEVEIFGDCEDGYYGWECDKQCRCEDSTEICDKLWGQCPKSHCRAGYRGDDCQDECSAMTYGFNCSMTCPANCADDVCDHVTGRCTNGCVAGWDGERCEEECSSGTYGHNCSLTCGSFCVDSLCHHVTGHCTNGCPPGRQGATCDEECPQGFYGQDCRAKCSNNCAGDTCHFQTGRCVTGCVQGFMGDLCDQELLEAPAEDEENESNAGLIVGLVVMVLMIIVLAVVIYRYRHYFLQTFEEIRNPNSRRDGREGDRNKNNRDIERASDYILMKSHHDSGGRGLGNRNDNSIDENDGNSKDNDGRLHSKSNTAVGFSEENEQDRDTAELRNTTTTTTATTSSTPGRPGSKKPQYLSLFSRDASADPPEHHSDAESPPQGPEEEKAPLVDVPKEGHLSSSSIVSTYSGRRKATLPHLKVSSFDSLESVSVDCLDVSTPLSSRRATDASDINKNHNNSNNSDYHPQHQEDTASTPTRITLSELPARVAQWLENPRHFSRERSMLPTGKLWDWKTALSDPNMSKNRYKDIFPYDQSRVMLTPLADDPHSDYYNASYIDGYKTEKEYIAAQGPMEKTLHDFLRLVWDTKCQRLVMLTNLAEMGRFKCQQYWPDEGAMTLADISVCVESTDVFADYKIRHLTLDRGGETRPVTMYHYTGWPDNCAPSSPWSLLLFRQKVRNRAVSGEGPIILHCSAGIGRTGTYLALDILLARAEHEGEVDVFDCVKKLRQQRINMVQTLAQYIFIYEALRASVLSSLPVPVEEFNMDRLLLGEKGLRQIDAEYERLQMCVGPAVLEDSEDGTPPELIGLPRDVHRVNIQNIDGGWGSAYINAVFLSNCRKSRAYIQTHSPADTEGAVHFLSMLIQHQVTWVVSLDSEQENEAVSYWPDTVESSVLVGPYKVTLLSMRAEQGMTVRNLRITFAALLGRNGASLEAGTNDSQEVRQVTCTEWPPSRSTPPSISVFLHSVMASTAHDDDKGPVVVHCRIYYDVYLIPTETAIHEVGLFCVTAAILERMRTEGHVAVNYVTAHMRVPRRENIVSVEQYEFLYACAQHQRDAERSCDVTHLEDSEKAEKQCLENSDHSEEGTAAQGNSDSVPEKETMKDELPEEPEKAEDDMDIGL